MRCGHLRRRGSGFSAFVLACVAVFLAARGIELPAMIVGGIAVIRASQWWNDPVRRVRQTVLSDAREHRVYIPDDQIVWDGLLKLYAKYTRTSRTYTQLAGQYAEIVGSMWETLKMTHDLREWRRIVGSVGAEWPTPYGDADGPLRASMSRAKAAAKKWQEAHDEAHSWTM